MKRLSLLALLFCLIATTTQTRAEDLKAYENDKFGFYVTYPQTWQMAPDEANAYFALYTPEALANQSDNLDLLAGLKIEILPATPKELADFLARKDLRQEVKGSNQYYVRDDDYYYLYTVIRGPNWNFLIVGYFPEKEKEAVYVPLYQKVVNTFTII